MANGHTGSDGSDPFSRMNRFGKWHRTAAENMEWGNNDAKSIIKHLFTSAGHRRNMLNSDFGATGIAFCSDPDYRYRTVLVYAGGFTINEAAAAKIRELKGITSEWEEEEEDTNVELETPEEEEEEETGSKPVVEVDTEAMKTLEELLK